jgi:hypothetical protein
MRRELFISTADDIAAQIDKEANDKISKAQSQKKKIDAAIESLASAGKAIVAALNNSCAQQALSEVAEAEATQWDLAMKLTTFIQTGKENGMPEENLKPFETKLASLMSNALATPSANFNNGSSSKRPKSSTGSSHSRSSHSRARPGRSSASKNRRKKNGSSTWAPSSSSSLNTSSGGGGDHSVVAAAAAATRSVPPVTCSRKNHKIAGLSLFQQGSLRVPGGSFKCSNVEL